MHDNKANNNFILFDYIIIIALQIDYNNNVLIEILTFFAAQCTIISQQ